MAPSPPGNAARDQRLSQIETLWSVVRQAHNGPAEQAASAQHFLLERYSPAIRGYLRAAVRDPEAADDLYQEFALKLLRGDFRRADPDRGRFRNLVKTALYHLVVDYRREQREQPRPVEPRFVETAAAAVEDQDAEREFLERWREQLLGRTWLALQETERRTGLPCYTVLRFRMDRPLLSSSELATELGRRLGRRLTVPAVRQALYRAREKFADLFVDQVAASLAQPSLDDLVLELGDLGLLSACRAALERRTRAA